MTQKPIYRVTLTLTEREHEGSEKVRSSGVSLIGIYRRGLGDFLEDERLGKLQRAKEETE